MKSTTETDYEKDKKVDTLSAARSMKAFLKSMKDGFVDGKAEADRILKAQGNSVNFKSGLDEEIEGLIADEPNYTDPYSLGYEIGFFRAIMSD